MRIYISFVLTTSVKLVVSLCTGLENERKPLILYCNSHLNQIMNGIVNLIKELFTTNNVKFKMTLGAIGVSVLTAFIVNIYYQGQIKFYELKINDVSEKVIELKDELNNAKNIFNFETKKIVENHNDELANQKNNLENVQSLQEMHYCNKLDKISDLVSDLSYQQKSATWDIEKLHEDLTKNNPSDSKIEAIKSEIESKRELIGHIATEISNIEKL